MSLKQNRSKKHHRDEPAMVWKKDCFEVKGPSNAIRWIQAKVHGLDYDGPMPRVTITMTSPLGEQDGLPFQILKFVSPLIGKCSPIFFSYNPDEHKILCKVGNHTALKIDPEKPLDRTAKALLLPIASKIDLPEDVNAQMFGAVAEIKEVEAAETVVEKASTDEDLEASEEAGEPPAETQETDVSKILLTELEIDTRIVKYLGAKKINTVGDILELVRQEGTAALLAIDGIGEKSLEDLKQALQKYGFEVS